ncbi:MAG: hypothetical protein ACREV5_04730 [Steroidobacter sp.]
MRTVSTALLLLICVACTSTPGTAPREYLDEQTAATITVVADPWIFSRERTNETADQRDFLNVYAIDVNRMGDHKQYFAVLQSLPLVDSQGRELPAPTLQLRTSADVLSLEPTPEEPRKLGLARPVAESYSLTSKWWYFPVDRQTLASVATSGDVQATLVVGETQTPYVLWRDGRAEVEELTSVLP